MGNLAESLSEVLAKLAEWLGVKPSQGKRLGALEQKLTAARAGNVDRLEGLKDELRKLETRAVQKKKESDAARGDMKRMIVREIEQAFSEIDRLRGRESIIVANIDRISVALSKIGELRAAQDQGVEEGSLDDIAMDLQEVFGNLKDADRAVRDLDRERYDAPERASVDVEQRSGELEGTKKAATELSESTLQRLKELETE